MHIDPWFLLAAANGTVSAAAVYFWHKANRWFLQSEYWRSCAGRASTDALNLHSELATLRHQNLIDAAKRREIARLGGKACQAKRAAADLAEAPARRAITTAALASTQFRPREEVVAPVLALRARKKFSQSGADVAAKQG